MNVYDYLLDSKKIIPTAFNSKKICFLDIETTGLNRQYSSIYLIGLLYFNEDKKTWCLRQYFANHIKEEEELLKGFNLFIKKFNLIITYNGDNFDIPFINYRMKKYNINNNIARLESLDLYKKIKEESSFLNLNNYKLKSIEQFLGIHRKDEYSGKDCISFYYQYIKNGNKILKDRILKHNFDDLYYLGDIIRIFDHLNNIKSFTISINSKDKKVCIKDIVINGDIIKVFCHISNADKNVNIIYYDNGFNLDWKSDSIVIDLEAREGLVTPTRKALFIDKKNFPSKINGLKDLSDYMVPNNIILIKVGNKYIIENIKNLIKELIFYVI
ncbi:ribonuclease H-like domain-containing protein [Tepidimicrobium xylanilyticum]|uniref:YprB ribonuclease H-like domain-containing protein n=1 Tax=Tepidimicrobium xylanilyticum TaxID=1123352 RepID=A0A1H2TZW8_9FIRM|nr:ribonuclease H-like domain-containing protein [Tepidimicrobium xylanilyticum]GMG98067.1 hypothetical protein EN5CB1_28930 [Tepidimicrobium xylanilyticum]SDW49515.1 hypothetical protein SAMN05660923_00854 [Tepidimicrobium xylanilyticum]